MDKGVEYRHKTGRLILCKYKYMKLEKLELKGVRGQRGRTESRFPRVPTLEWGKETVDIRMMKG